MRYRKCRNSIVRLCQCCKSLSQWRILEHHLAVTAENNMRIRNSHSQMSIKPLKSGATKRHWLIQLAVCNQRHRNLAKNCESMRGQDVEYRTLWTVYFGDSVYFWGMHRTKTKLYNIVHLLGSFAKMRKVTISFVMSVCPSANPSAWKNSASTGRIFVTFEFQHLSKICRRKFKFH